MSRTGEFVGAHGLSEAARPVKYDNRIPHSLGTVIREIGTGQV